ncbi:hypothetical protein LCGC14_0224800 [marine sediment metagenome]|uniref:Uncharacterized protein n=1 Tax=marine sediment metagenome TaxID=412755 RepID=A0A0F9WWY6_9ZZZZ
MKVRKCKCCRRDVITKKCFIGRHKKDDKYNAWKLWYDKKSNIICFSCESEIMEFINKIEEVNFETLREAINDKHKKDTRPLRSQIWYLIDLGIINTEMFQHK